MKKQSNETELGVRLVKPHTKKCDAERALILSPITRGVQWYTRGEFVRRDAAGRKTGEGICTPRWLRFVCNISRACPAECLVRVDILEDFAADMLHILSERKATEAR